MTRETFRSSPRGGGETQTLAEQHGIVMDASKCSQIVWDQGACKFRQCEHKKRRTNAKCGTHLRMYAD